MSINIDKVNSYFEHILSTIPPWQCILGQVKPGTGHMNPIIF